MLHKCYIHGYIHTVVQNHDYLPSAIILQIRFDIVNIHRSDDMNDLAEQLAVSLTQHAHNYYAAPPRGDVKGLLL